MNREKAQTYINTLTDNGNRKEILIGEAPEILGESKYERLYKAWGPGKKGKDALLAEKEPYIFILSEVKKKIEAAENASRYPSYSDLERTKEKKKIADISFWLSIALTVIFFFIGSIPDFKWWFLKLPLAVGGSIAIYYVYRRITRFLMKVT